MKNVPFCKMCLPYFIRPCKLKRLQRGAAGRSGALKMGGEEKLESVEEGVGRARNARWRGGGGGFIF